MSVTVETHALALRWAHVLGWQVGRLRDQREATYEASLLTRRAGHYGVEDSEPFHRLEAERQFTITAADRLVYALQSFDDDLRIGDSGVDPNDLRLMRNVLEHPKGWSAAAAEQRGLDTSHHSWQSGGGGGQIGQLVDDEALRRWATAVYEELRVMDVR